MNNEQREAVYLRDRSELTPAQRRRITKKEHSQRTLLRRAHSDVKRSDRSRKRDIRLMFRFRRGYRARDNQEG